MLINCANSCEAKLKRISIKVKILKDTCLLGKKVISCLDKAKISYSCRQTKCFLTFLNII